MIVSIFSQKKESIGFIIVKNLSEENLPDFALISRVLKLLSYV